MLNEQELERIVREVMQSMNVDAKKPAAKCEESKACGCSGPSITIDPARDYPLAEKRPDLIRTPRGKRLDDITLKNVMSGEITAEDLRITPEALEYQAQVAEAVGRPQLAENFRRAAEMKQIPDERILEMYNALRPNRSTREELESIADELEHKYGAKRCAALVREAAAVYARRRVLRTE